MTDTESASAEALLRAFLALRGEDVGLSQNEAAAQLFKSLPQWVAPYVHSFDPTDAEDAVSRVVSAVWRGGFAGTTPGEAVKFARRVALHYCLDRSRSALRHRHTHEKCATEVAAATFGSAPDHSTTVAQLRILNRVRNHLLLAIPERRINRAKVYLDYRLHPEDHPPLPGNTETERRYRDRVYQDHYTGKKYLLEVAPRVEPCLEPYEIQAMHKLLSGEGPDARPLSTDEDGSDE